MRSNPGLQNVALRMAVVAVMAACVPTLGSTAVAVQELVQATPAPPRDVTFCQLASDPAAFDGAQVRLTAFINFAFEDFTLWDPTCSWNRVGSGLWLTYGGVVNSGAVYCCPGEGLPRQGAAPYPLVDDQTLRDFRTLLAREGDTVVRASVTGTLLVRKEPKTILDHSGYGHMGCCSLLVITRVEYFEPHVSKDLDYSASLGYYDARDLRCESGRLEGNLSFSDKTALLVAQAAADRGDRDWALRDPGRVALEAAQRVHGAEVKSLRRVKSSPGRQVFEWEQNRRLTTVVVARPYWLSKYAQTSAVAWVVTVMKTESCD
jgi:hypothetical protein